MNVAHEKLAAALIILTLVSVVSPMFIPKASAQSAGSIQADFYALVNAERASLGKTPLVANSQLESAAYLHSKDMGDNNYFDHTSQDGRQFSQRITNAGYWWVSCAENIAMAYGGADAAKVYDMWKNSAGHYANMIGNYADAGLGVYTVGGYTYYTLDLGRSQSSPTQTPKPTVSPSATPQPTATPTPTASPIPVPTATPTPKPTTTPTPTPKPTTTPTGTPTHPPTATPTPKPTTTATTTQTPKPTATPSPTPETSTQQPTATPTPDPTSTATTQTTTTPEPSTASNPDPTNTSVSPTPTPTIPEFSLILLLAATLLIAIGVVVKHTVKP